MLWVHLSTQRDEQSLSELIVITLELHLTNEVGNGNLYYRVSTPFDGIILVNELKNLSSRRLV